MYLGTRLRFLAQRPRTWVGLAKKAVGFRDKAKKLALRPRPNIPMLIPL